MKVYDNISELVGGTPLLRLHTFEKAVGAKAKILAKLEYYNPAGSAKDRISREMLDDAFERGIINENSVIIEPTSGNTGIGLAAIAASRAMTAIIVMPETMSEERRKLIAAYGARLVLTEGSKGMTGAIEKANELAAENPNSFIPSQFTNPAAPAAHYKTTGPEIWADTDGEVDIFIAGVGSGGTITGTGNYLKEKKPSVRVVAVEPADSPFLSQGRAGAHKIQGIGAGFIPQALDTEVYDEIITATTEQAYSNTRLLAKTQGVLTGISSGAALSAAATLAAKDENEGKTIVVLLPDSGERYLSAEGLF